MFHLEFENPELQVLCHSSQEKFIPRILVELSRFDLQHHFILFSSGTTGGDLKGYAISKEALFTNADAVNKHFKLTRNDVWGLSLPTYHVGGLSVLARADLLKNKVIDARSWDPEAWSKKMKDVTITTVVPTQLYDLLKQRIKSSPNLRYLVVGGDLLSHGLKEEALKLGWPVIRTFGMSEVCSQLASTKSPHSDELEILPIHTAKTDENQRLLVKSESLFTLQFTMGEKFNVILSQDLCDKDGYYRTSDRAEIQKNVIRHLGRMGDEFKIAGHLVSFNHLKDTLQSYLVKEQLYGQMEFILEEDERKGKRLVLLTLSSVFSDKHLSKISNIILPVKIDEVREVVHFERTQLGKLRK